MLKQFNLSDLLTFTRASVRTRLNNVGAIVSDAINAPSLVFSPIARSASGLLIEDSKTNFTRFSTDITQSAWGKSRVTLVQGSVLDPMGNPAYRMVEANGDAGSKELNQTLQNSFVAGNTYAFGAFARIAEVGAPRRLKLAVGSASIIPGSLSVTYDLVAGTVTGSVGASSSGCVKYENGWCFCWFNVAVTQTATPALYATLADATGATNYTGDGVSGAYVWGYQSENSLVPTSLVVTGAATATRATELAVVSDLSKMAFNTAEGTLVCQVEVPVLSSSTKGIFCLSDGTSSNRITAYFGATGARISTVVSGASANAIAAVESAVAGTRLRLAMRYKNNQCALSVNGAAVVQGPAMTTPSGLNQIRLGCFQPTGGNECLNSTIQDFQYIPVGKTDAELIALSGALV